MSLGVDQAWLDGLKVGDPVFMRWGFDGMSVSHVSKITPTQIHVGGSKFRRKGGSEIGNHSRYNFNSIEPVTEDLLDLIREKKLRRRAAETDFHKLPFDILKKIMALVPEEEKSGS